MRDDGRRWAALGEVGLTAGTARPRSRRWAGEATWVRKCRGMPRDSREGRSWCRWESVWMVRVYGGGLPARGRGAVRVRLIDVVVDLVSQCLGRARLVTRPAREADTGRVRLHTSVPASAILPHVQSPLIISAAPHPPPSSRVVGSWV